MSAVQVSYNFKSPVIIREAEAAAVVVTDHNRGN